MQYANVPPGRLEQNGRLDISPNFSTSLLGVPLPLSLPSLASWLYFPHLLDQALTPELST